MLVCEKSQSTVPIPGMLPTRIKEGVTHVLQQYKEGSGEEGSGTLSFTEKQFHPHATDLNLFGFFFHVLVFTFRITVPMTNNAI